MHDVGNGCPYLIHYTCNDPSAKTSLRDSITRLPFSSSTEWSQPTASTIPAIRTLSSDNGLASPCLGQDQSVHLDLLLSSEHTWGCRCSVSALVILLSPCGPLEDRLEHSPPPAWNSFKLQSANLVWGLPPELPLWKSLLLLPTHKCLPPPEFLLCGFEYHMLLTNIQ